VDEVWNVFFASDALYSLNEAIKDMGDKIDSDSLWQDPTNASHDGQPVL